MKGTVFPTIEEALYLHELLIDRFGGQPGVRDIGLLHSALARPASGYYESLSLQAAALLQSVLMNHAFVDGNKRVAFALTATFLYLNGYRLRVSATRAEQFLIGKVIRGKTDVQKIADWLERHMEGK